MGVVQAHQVHHALDGAVLARRSVKRVEHDVGLQLGQAAATSRSMSSSVTLVQPRVAQRLGDALAAGQRHFALARPAAHQHDDMDFLVHSAADPLDFPLEVMLTCRFHPAPDFLAQRLDVGAGRATEVEQEIAMLFADLRAADRKPAAARRIDQPPGLVAGRVLEGRAAGAAAQRLRLPRGPGRCGPSRRRMAAGSPGLSAKGRSDDDRACRAVRCGGRCSRSRSSGHVDAVRPSAARRRAATRTVADFAAISAAVHADEAADRAGDASAGIRARRCRRRARSRRPGSRSLRRRS